MFFKIESFKHRFDWNGILWNLTKFQLNQTTNRKNENNNYLNELNELKFCENVFQTDAESFSLKNKKALIQIKSFIGYYIVNITTKKLCLLTQFSVKVLQETLLTLMTLCSSHSDSKSSTLKVAFFQFYSLAVSVV